MSMRKRGHGPPGMGGPARGRPELTAWNDKKWRNSCIRYG